MKTYTKGLNIKKLMLLSVMAASSKVQADITNILNGGDSTKTLSSVTTLTNTVNTRVGAPVGASISADIAAVKTVVDAGATAAALATVDTVVDTINANVGTPTNTGGTPTLAAILGDVANLSVATSLAYVIANVQGNPVTQVATAQALSPWSTTVTVTGNAAVAGAVTTALTNYNNSVTTANTSIDTAEAQATQSNANTQTAITNVNTAISNFNTLMSEIIADSANNTYIDSAGGGEAAIKWAQDQLLRALQQLKAKQATA